VTKKFVKMVGKLRCSLQWQQKPRRLRLQHHRFLLVRRRQRLLLLLHYLLVLIRKQHLHLLLHYPLVQINRPHLHPRHLFLAQLGRKQPLPHLRPCQAQPERRVLLHLLLLCLVQEERRHLHPHHRLRALVVPRVKEALLLRHPCLARNSLLVVRNNKKSLKLL
jgi:hypothetical protein